MVTRAMLLLLLTLIGRRADAQVSGPAPAWRIVADIPLPGKPARFDYQSLDASTGWLWIAHMGAGQVLAVDVRARRVVAHVPDMAGATGIRAVPSLRRVFVSLSASHAIAVLDSRDGRLLRRVPGGRFPDGMAYAPRAGKLFVSDEYGHQELVIDVQSSRALRPIPLGGEVGNTQYDSVGGRIWAAVQSRNELVAIDPRTDSIARRISVPGVEHPHGFTLDVAHQRIYVTGEANATLGVLDLQTERITRTYRVADAPDVVELDPARHRLFVACESGVITPFEIRGDTLVPLPEYRAPHAHSVAVDPATGLIYVPLENVGGRPTLRILRLE